MDNIFDHFTAYQLRQIFQQKHWPEEFKDAMHQEIAYELLDSWLESVDEETYNERVRGIIENMTYGYEDDNGNEMTDFIVTEERMNWVFIVCRDNSIEKVKFFKDFWEGAKFTDTFIQNLNPSLTYFPAYNRNENYKDGNLTVGLYREGA